MKRTITGIAIPIFMLSACISSPVEEAKPVRKDVVEYVFGSGTLEADDEYTLTALTDGYITGITVDENNKVTPGQLIAQIDNAQNDINTVYADKLLDIARSNATAGAPALQQARVRLDLARSSASYDSLNMERHRKLLEAGSISAATFQNVELQYKRSMAESRTAEQNYALLSEQAKESLVVNESQKVLNQSVRAYNQVKALGAGTVLRKLKNPGDFVRKGDAIVVIGNIEALHVEVDVDENSIGKVKPGQKALIRLNTHQDSVFTGTVTEIMPAYNEEKQSFIVKIKPGAGPDFKVVKTQVQANIEVGVAKNALIIPRKFINYSNQVMIKDSKEPVTLKVKYVSTEWVQVLDGLKESDIVILPKIPAK
jgi:HlyD family secretion protein